MCIRDSIATTCHEIQRHTPFIVANRLILALLNSLGIEAKRYTSGLESALASFDSAIALRFDLSPSQTVNNGRYQKIFLRFFDGVGTDHKIFIACDDAQWIDPESLDILNALAASYTIGPLSQLFAERNSHAGKTLRKTNGTIVLQPFGAQESAQLARSRYPNLTGISLETVVHHGNGNPFEILTLCEELVEGHQLASAVGENRVRDVIARRVREMDSADREFLQFCSLLGEPIEYRMLFALHTPGEVAALVSGRARPYLMAVGPALRFRHALVAEAVRSTLDFDVPLRRQIITALQSQIERIYSDYERIAEHAKAIGDKELARNALFDLANLAFSRKVWTVVIAACETALELGEIDPDNFIRFYTQYTIALRSNNEDEKAASVLEDALNKARTRRIDEGIGVLLSMLMATLWVSGRARKAIDVCRTWAPSLKHEADRAEIFAFAMMIAACAFDDATYHLEEERFLHLTTPPNDYVKATSHQARAFFYSIHGDYERSIAEIDLGIATADPKRRQDDTLAFTKLLFDFRGKGCNGTEDRLATWLANNRLAGKEHDFGTIFRAWLSVARGEWQAALAFIEESLFSDITAAARIQQLSIRVMIECLVGETHAVEERIGTVLVELRGWQSNDALLQVAPWLLLRKRVPDLERDLNSAILRLAEQPPSPIALTFVPFGLALLAQKIGRTTWLRMFADSEYSQDRSPWAVMQWQLARGIALQALKDARGDALLAAAATSARTLNADFFAAYAAFRCGDANDSELQLLNQLRLAELGHSLTRPSHGLTARELQVARLVGDGKSNREIAEELVLSERTIERHLGNVFDKLQLESRAKLMRWLFEND